MILAFLTTLTFNMPVEVIDGRQLEPDTLLGYYIYNGSGQRIGGGTALPGAPVQIQVEDCGLWTVTAWHLSTQIESAPSNQASVPCGCAGLCHTDH